MKAAEKPDKIKNYKLLEVFIQIDFLDGFSYIDKAGEIVNSFVRETKEVPKFQMGLNGLVFKDLTETIQEAKVSPTQIWIHFVEPKNLGKVSIEAATVIDRFLKVIKPSIYKRIGWRTYFAREYSGEVPVKKLKVSEDTDSYELQSITLAKKYKEYQIRLEVSPLQHITDEAKTALLFDVDLSKEATKYNSSSTLEQFRKTLKSDALIETLEGLLRKDD